MNRKIVFLFPGQGSQTLGMGADLYRKYPLARRRFDQADDLLGYRLSRICFQGPAEGLNTDINAQLAVYTLSCIVSDLLKRAGIRPDAVSGYSSGYYAAAYAAGGLTFDKGLAIVKQAGKILLDAGAKIDGKMAVIFGLPHKDVAGICAELEDVDVAIINTAQQIVVAGRAQAVNRAMESCLAAGALDAYLLPVETAYHSRFMVPARARFLNEIAAHSIGDPHLPIISYATLKPASEKNALFQTMASQLPRTVCWRDLIHKLRDDGYDHFLEVGPGAVIARTVRWIDRTIDISSVGSARALQRVTAHRLSQSPK
jgi:[acyl-carrier-protein] S-malonyltransferase